MLRDKRSIGFPYLQNSPRDAYIGQLLVGLRYLQYLLITSLADFPIFVWLLHMYLVRISVKERFLLKHPNTLPSKPIPPHIHRIVIAAMYSSSSP